MSCWRWRPEATPGASLGIFERAFHGSWLVASARQGSTLVGIGRVISDGVPHAFVTEMIVDESIRGIGVGAELLRRFVERTLERGITSSTGLGMSPHGSELAGDSSGGHVRRDSSIGLIRPTSLPSGSATIA